MFPIRDHNPSNTTPFVTWALIAINVVVFLGYFPQLSGNDAQLHAFYTEWALIPAEIGGADPSLLTYMFLHGGWMHLILNMLFLFVFGDNIEDLLGHVGFLVFYLATGVAAGYAQMASDPASIIPMVGASGAIAGVMGGYLLMFPRARVDILIFLVIFIRVFTLPAWIVLGFWFALQLVNGAATVGATGGGVAYWAHAGGFVAGLVLLLPIWLRRGGRAYWAQSHGAPPHAETQSHLGQGRASRDRFESGPIQSRTARGYERAAHQVPGHGRLSDSRIPRAGRAPAQKEPPKPRGPWGG